MKAKDCILRGLGLASVLGLVAVLPIAAHAAQVPATQTPGAAAPQAVATGPLKVAVIDGNRVLAESAIGMQVQQEAQAAAAEWDTRVRSKQAELDTLAAQGQEQRLTLTDDALARIQASIEQLQVELERLRTDAQRALQRLSEEAQTRINERLIPAVEQLASAEGYDLILDTRIQGILYYADTIDATDRFIEVVNASPPVGQGSQQ